MVPGDGLGEEEKLEYIYTIEDCINACRKKKGVTGITMSKRATKRANMGDCYCETGMKGVNSKATSFKTCYLIVRKIRNLYLVFDTSMTPFIVKLMLFKRLVVSDCVYVYLVLGSDQT